MAKRSLRRAPSGSRAPRLPRLLIAALPLAAPAGATTSEAHRLLAARAERPPQAPGPPPAAARGAGSPAELFFFSGANNAVAVRALPDVSGDGKAEILVGIEESGVPNVFCLDGASAGPRLRTEPAPSGASQRQSTVASPALAPSTA